MYFLSSFSFFQTLSRKLFGEDHDVCFQKKADLNLMIPTDNDVTEENINFHADTNVTPGDGENAGGQANISR